MHFMYIFFQLNAPLLSLLWARPQFHHHTENNERYTRETQKEMLKYISYTIKALEPTKEKEMAITALLSQGN